MTRVAGARYACLAAVLLLLGEALGSVRAAWPAPVADVGNAENLDALIAIRERARQDLGRQIEQYNETARKKAQEAKGLLGRITKLRQEAQMSGARVELLELQSRRLQDSARELNEDIARIDRSMKKLVEALRHRLLDIYKYDARAELNLLLSTEDTHEAMIMSYMLDRLSRQDRMILEELGGKIKELKGAKVNLEKNRAQLARQSEELKEERGRHHAAIAQANALLRDVLGQRRKAEEAAPRDGGRAAGGRPEDTGSAAPTTVGGRSGEYAGPSGKGASNASAGGPPSEAGAEAAGLHLSRQRGPAGMAYPGARDHPLRFEESPRLQDEGLQLRHRHPGSGGGSRKGRRSRGGPVQWVASGVRPGRDRESWRQPHHGLRAPGQDLGERGGCRPHGVAPGDGGQYGHLRRVQPAFRGAAGRHGEGPDELSEAPLGKR